MSLTKQERAQGCMIGAAYGDSLGAATEFISSERIKKTYGNDGITELVPVYGKVGNITDDTQMAIATAEGILNSTDEEIGFNEDLVVQNIWQAYLRWFETQADSSQARAPGATCLSALSDGRLGTLRDPLNGSPGCGAIMRAHPLGVAFENNKNTFKLGVLSGVLTHGHPNAYIPAGFLSALTGEIMQGSQFVDALQLTIKRLKNMQNAEGTQDAISRALSGDHRGDTFEVIDNEVGGGGGWHGHDALAIGVFAVLRANEDPLEAVRIAANHSGDTDSTGSIAGALVGALHGPRPFIDTLQQQDVHLEHKERLESLAFDLAEIDVK